MRTLPLLAVALTSAACTISTYEQGPARPPPPPGPPPPTLNGGAAPPTPGVRTIRTARQPNHSKLRALKARGAFCSPEEVAQGTWAKFDCQPYNPIRRAKPLGFVAMLGQTALNPTGMLGGVGIPGLPGTALPGGTTGTVGDGNNQQSPFPFPLPFPIPGQPQPGGGGGGVNPTPTGPIPSAVDLRTANLDGPIKDQGAVGTCTAVSLSTAMEVAIRKQGKQDVVSPLHVWSQYAMPNMGMAGDQTENTTLTVEQTWQYDPAKACEMMKMPADDCGEAYGVTSGSGQFDPELQAEKAKADNQGRFKLTQVEEFSKPANPQEMAAVLAGGDAIWIALSVDPQAWKTSSMNDGVIPDYQNVGQAGHAVTFVGYRTVGSGKQFLIHNSWSERWGQGGYAWISEQMVQRWTRNAYKIVVDGKSSPMPGGGGGAQPQSNGCAQGQVRDAVNGQCTSPCASGSAPAAGVCLPAVPGFPLGPQPGPQPQPGQPQGGGGCPQGQVKDSVSGQCANACAGGAPPMGGICLPGGFPR
jgi:hypothetical protein